VLISRDDTPITLCGGGDDTCRGRCTLSGACGPPVPTGAPCGRVCHRCDGAGRCAFAFPNPATEPAAECLGDTECGSHCDPGTGDCGAPAAAETICGSGDGCSVCQEITSRGMTCVARADTPPGVCTRPGGAAQCVGRCGSFGVCEWPGQERSCGECRRCNGDGFCETAAGGQVSAEDCTPDSADCRGVCLGGRCGFANSDNDPCGGSTCRWCQTGICEFIDNGTDPLGQCNTLDHPICGETCDGAGACAPAPGPNDPDGPVACGDECRWCSGGACLAIDGYIDDPFGRCEADQVCSAGACSTCGNGVFEAGEVCDPNDPAHPCEGVCTSADPCTTALAIDCQCVLSPVLEADDGSDGCCPPITVRGVDPNCVRWPTPFRVNPDPMQRYTYAQLPAIDGATGTLYIGGRDQSAPTPRPRIFALSPSGQILWDVSTASNPAFAAAATTSPVLLEGKLYFGRGQWLAVVDIATRTTTEVVNLNSLLKEPPVVASSGLLVVGTAEDGFIRGVNPVDGSIEWTYSTGAGALTGPGTRAGRYVYWGAVEAIHAVDLFIPPTASGAARCFAPPGALTTGGVAPGARIDQVTTGSLYLADQEGTLFGLFPADLSGIGCTPFAQDATTVGGTIDATPVTLSDGSVVAGGNDPALNPNPAAGAYAFSPDLSTVRWTAALGSHVRFGPAVGTGPDGELVYIGLRQLAGVRILAVQPGLGGATQRLLWTHDYTVPGAPTAALASPLALGRSGTLYFRTSDGSLNAIVTGSTRGLSNRGWPKRYGDYGNTGNAP
jgi:outer membrane protein assembly factor BamB